MLTFIVLQCQVSSECNVYQELLESVYFFTKLFKK